MSTFQAKQQELEAVAKQIQEINIGALTLRCVAPCCATHPSLWQEIQFLHGKHQQCVGQMHENESAKEVR